MDNPRRNTLVLCEESCWDTCLGERRHWQWGQKLIWASCHIAKITLCCIFTESIIALHILSEQTNAAFGTSSQQIRNQDERRPRINQYALTDLFSPFPGWLSRRQTSRGNRWRWSWSWNWLWSARSALWWQSVQYVGLHCISVCIMHSLYVFHLLS